jgi:hypothetical protein
MYEDIINNTLVKSLRIADSSQNLVTKQEIKPS